MPARSGAPAALKRAARAGVSAFSAWYARRQARRGRIDGALDRALRAGARLYARLELPLAVNILEGLRVNRPELWEGAATREGRGCWHGYRLRLDLSDFYQRWAYFLTRYHEVPLQVLLWRALRPGDTVIDGGANNGLVSLFAAWRVGPRGRILAFEPNPRVFEQLLWHARANRLEQIDPRRAGLGDQPSEMLLQVPGKDNLGAGTFCPLPARYQGVVADRATAPVIRGDDLDLPAAPLTIKLDVEGFELRALKGMATLLAQRRPLVITEINRELLIAAGDSPYALFQSMHAHGYHGYGFTAARALLRNRKLILWRVTGPAPVMPRDIAWVHPGSEAARRLAPYLVPRSSPSSAKVVP